MYLTDQPEVPDYEGEKALRIAQSTVQNLQDRLNKKEETISRLEQMLRNSRDDLERTNKQHAVFSWFLS